MLPTTSATVTDRIAEFIDVLNAKEIERRVVVNLRHLEQYGRLLYPEGGQYVVYSADRPGRKFVRIVETQTVGGSRSVHCFIDRATGDVLKAAGWKAPATGVRFNLLDDDSRLECFARCGHAVGYLYR